MKKQLIVPSMLVAFLGASLAVAGEAWLGSWKLNAAKSQPGANAIRVETLKFEATADGIKLTSDGTDPQGKKIQAGYTSKFDGKEVKWTGNPMADTAAPRKIDDNSYENSWKIGGKGTVTAKVVVSKDGKTLTVTQDGTGPNGEKVHSVGVYDRQ
jgi:hypothetical protein